MRYVNSFLRLFEGSGSLGVDAKVLVTLVVVVYIVVVPVLDNAVAAVVVVDDVVVGAGADIVVVALLTNCVSHTPGLSHPHPSCTWHKHL